MVHPVVPPYANLITCGTLVSILYEVHISPEGVWPLGFPTIYQGLVRERACCQGLRQMKLSLHDRKL